MRLQLINYSHQLDLEKNKEKNIGVFYHVNAFMFFGLKGYV